MTKITAKKYVKYIIFFSIILLLMTYLVIKMLDTAAFKLINKKNNPQQNSIADSFVNQASLISFTAGQPQFYFTSQQILHYPGDKESTAIKPRLKAYSKKDLLDTRQKKKIPWLVEAEQAWVSSDLTQIRMESNVIVKQALSKFETSILWVWPEKEYIQTDKAVKITTTNALITAIGMNANLITTQYHLFDDVRVNINRIKP